MEIIETIEQSLEIERIIDFSNNFTIIVSPYLKISNRLRPRLSDCFKRNKNNLILFRENELTKEERNWLGSVTNVQLLPIKNLHAKCYINEKTALVTSMNLYEYSQINNHEIGIKLSLEHNKDQFNKLLKIVHSIIKTDHPGFDFSRYSSEQPKEQEIENATPQKYSMSALGAELSKEYDFPDKHRGLDSTYEYICQLAMKLHRFDPKDYKFDGSALKRTTELDPSVYNFLKSEIIKKGRRK
jgi:hypothetical protein